MLPISGQRRFCSKAWGLWNLVSRYVRRTILFTLYKFIDWYHVLLWHCSTIFIIGLPVVKTGEFLRRKNWSDLSAVCSTSLSDVTWSTAQQNNVKRTGLASKMINYNFWIMDALASCLIFVSAHSGERRRTMKKQETEIHSSLTKLEHLNNGDCQEIRMNLSRYFVLNTLYFSLMACMVITQRYYPIYIIYIQYMTVVGFVLIAFDGWFRPAVSYPLGIALVVLWFLSGGTQFRWILNDVIIVIFTLMVGDIQFKNFTVLQIFMWSAFLYDVCLLAGTVSLAPSLFSVKINECDALICHLFQLHDKWELPSVFTVKFGNSTQVYLGTGDILLGSLVVNFSKCFFKSTKYVVVIVLSFSFALGLLSQIDSVPFPALASIVPVCTLAIIVCAIVSGKTRQLFSVKREHSGDTIGLIIAWSISREEGSTDRSLVFSCVEVSFARAKSSDVSQSKIIEDWGFVYTRPNFSGFVGNSETFSSDSK